VAHSALLAIAEAANRGDAVRIGVATGGITVYGLPITKAEFFEKVTHAVAGQMFRAEKVKNSEKDEVWASTYQQYQDFYSWLEAAIPDEAEGLFFVAPHVINAAGSHSSPPGVFVPFDQVHAWWYGEANWKATARDGGGGLTVDVGDLSLGD
jgi:hypothetical protein